MKNLFRCSVLLAMVVSFAGATGLAQSSGDALYKTKCANCHGSTGMANAGVSKLMKVKPITDPDVKKLSEAEMIQMVHTGSGKMQSYKGELTDAQIKDSVDYFRAFLK